MLTLASMMIPLSSEWFEPDITTALPTDSEDPWVASVLCCAYSAAFLKDTRRLLHCPKDNP